MLDNGCGCPLCSDAAPDEIARQVSGAGWHLTAVLPGQNSSGWAYSVGLWHSFRHPEVCIFGLPPGRNGLVNVAAEAVREGRRLAPGGVLEDVLIGYPMQIRPVDPSWAGLFVRAQEFYTVAVPVMQLVWPDQDGRFPWQLGFDECFRDSQPHLWLPVDDHPPGDWVRVLRRQLPSGSHRHL